MGRSSIQRALYYLTDVSPERPWWGLLAFIVGLFGIEILAAFVGDRLAECAWLGLPLQVLAPLAAFALAVAIFAVASRVAAARYSLTLTQREPRPHRGLILPLGPYRSFTSLSRDDVEHALALLASDDPGQVRDGLDRLHVEKSNLWPQLAAIQYHLEGGALRDCWLITTRSESKDDAAGSEATAPIVEAFVRSLPGGPAVSLHTGADYTVTPGAYTAIYEIVDRIFRRAPYRPAHLIADVTGGTKLMTIGIALACLSPGRKMEYTSSDRDWRGEPVPEGEMRPVLVDVGAVLNRGDLEHRAGGGEEQE
jgi:hypothetical protein